MAGGLLGKVTSFLSSPQGRRATEKAQRMAKDPATRRKIDDAVGQAKRRFGGSGGRGAGGGPTGGGTPGH